ncbi:MAG: hypothetical protein R3C05_08525 [Pirellulaceae bacterium]
MMRETLLVQDSVEFKNETVYMSGKSFYGCRFFRCTLVVREGGIPNLVGCTLECCTWHFDILVSDHRRWDSFLQTMSSLVRDSLPRAFAEPNAGDQS